MRNKCRLSRKQPHRSHQRFWSSFLRHPCPCKPPAPTKRRHRLRNLPHAPMPKKHARGRPLNPSDRRPPPPPQSSPSRSVWLRVHWLARRAPRQFLDSCSHGPSAQIVKASSWGTSLQTPWCGMAGFLTLRKRSTAARHRWRPQSRTQGRSRARTQTADP